MFTTVVLFFSVASCCHFIALTVKNGIEYTGDIFLGIISN